ncbi:Glycosyltransferase involved in cell wall bisynthesis [Amphritea atlantica]|uniref:Glycosyltransferase involved in cell wall bisynthesis n=1 Tax=Amphritea atlantica TaxID=355243 RepID=A0A1H9JZ04_9GAMM|nr:glycosyltransferase family 2 protein [Amphritea atlantica]SEQ92040.1 Glycosyltransferase involved in cell wall bisynthesis [Amphritea atlantica]
MPNPISIAIVTPSFNQAPFVEETIRSVVNQQYPELQYVVIDGGSTDGSQDIIEAYSDQLHFYTSEPDRGHAHALNKGFAETDCEIMAWINSDDKYTPQALHTVARIFELFPEVEWITGFNGLWNKEGVMTTAQRNPKNIYDFLTGKYNWVQQESTFWRRSLWQKAGGYIDESQKYMVDGELWCRFFQHAELYSIDAILGGYRIHDQNRAIQNAAECHQEMLPIIDAMKRELPQNVITTAKKINALRKIRKVPILKRLGLSRMISTHHLDSNFQEIDYKNIHYANGRWQIRTLPYK